MKDLIYAVDFDGTLCVSELNTLLINKERGSG